MPRLYIKGIGMMTGLIIGAGVFALPYAFSQAGVFGERFISSSPYLLFIFCTNGTGRFLSIPKAGTGSSDMWKCIWAKKPNFSACSRRSALITSLC